MSLTIVLRSPSVVAEVPLLRNKSRDGVSADPRVPVVDLSLSLLPVLPGVSPVGS